MNPFAVDEPEELALLLADLGVDWAPDTTGQMAYLCQRCPACGTNPAQVVVTYRLGFRRYVESVCLVDADYAVRDARRADARDVTVLIPVTDGYGRSAA